MVLVELVVAGKKGRMELMKIKLYGYKKLPV
jgi:hypothetical protein